ncbi:MAG: EamA family transporter RarD [Bowdeniella nasicola]|nr:EamA family transporter RarD [Bowdeniella nasicola]
MSTVPDSASATPDRSGLFLGVAAYAIWGAFPLYFALLARVGALEVVAHRAIWGLVFCLVLITATGRLPRFWRHLRQRSDFIPLSAAGLLIAVNWTTYVYGVTTGRTLDAALGYFINPLTTVLLAVLVLSERLRRLQWAAIILGATAVIILVVAYGEVPYIALTLATTFSLYGLVKKQVGQRVGPLEGMAIETIVLLPLAVGYLAYLSLGPGLSAGADQPGLIALLIASGPLTAVPLLIFAAAARRLPLALIGLLQYMTPACQTIIALWIFHEPLPPERLAGFALVWVAIVFLMADSVLALRRQPRPGKHSQG